MNKSFMKMVWILMFLMILMYISSGPVTAHVVTNEVQVDEQTRQRLEETYNLDPPEESQTQQHFFSGDWGMSFRTDPPDLFDRLVHVVPFSLRPLAWIFRIFV
ncbi:hypothetical protein C0Q44_27110 [Paenibacillus sp. PCH8]|uniref:hypothetical protein n=1 Tax=Paenibacillus sp. PCH8 TaxID=2066524 RepID=UPI000CF9DEA5|nr:hypothetical protein [Paenibacillus sp. PCH8]PQP80454.1 hypothetical protein C0Q44_27110 [Paenibacillus sp. PCH8]